MTLFRVGILSVVLSTLAWAEGTSPTLEMPAASSQGFTQDLTFNVLNPAGSIIVSAITGQSALVLSVEYERAWSPRWSWEVSPGLLTASLLGSPLLAITLAGGVRYFFTGRAPQGWWIQPDLAVTTLRGLGPPEWAGTLSAYTGYTFITRGGFTASLGGGVSWRVGALGFGVLPALRANLGYAF